MGKCAGNDLLFPSQGVISPHHKDGAKCLTAWVTMREILTKDKQVLGLLILSNIHLTNRNHLLMHPQLLSAVHDMFNLFIIHQLLTPFSKCFMEMAPTGFIAVCLVNIVSLTLRQLPVSAALLPS